MFEWQEREVRSGYREGGMLQKIIPDETIRQMKAKPALTRTVSLNIFNYYRIRS